MTPFEVGQILLGLGTLVVLIAGFWIANYQFRDAAKSRRLETLLALFSAIRPSATADVGALTDSLPDDFELDALPADSQTKVRDLIYSYQRLGYLLYSGWLKEDDTIPLLGNSCVRDWEKLKHQVRKIRQCATVTSACTSSSSLENPSSTCSATSRSADLE